LELDGPNLVRVHDLVVDDEAVAIVMDLVEGVDLRDYLRRNGQLSPARALDVVLGVLEALAVVHEAGIVHRDVKPENILIESDAQGGLRPKLTDFGISTLTHSPRASRMTDVVGTPTYMAPELAEGEPPSPASDLYALGVVFFDLLTGVPPFDAPHPIGMLRAHREEPVPPIPGLAPAVAGILGDMLAKTPRRRPPSAREAWRALVGAAD
nr:serine/threonine-protein kinase [Micromonospora sp. DSM 115978]